MMPQLATKEQCSGCGVCMNICPKSAITMKADNEGFLQPFVDLDKCVECGTCDMKCPAINPFDPKGAERPKVFALWSNKDRRVSSSGGAFSAFARYVLKNDGLVYGAVFDHNLRCHHIAIDNIDGLTALRGSKYVQSEIGWILQSVKTNLAKGSMVLFTGTPCQVAGLRSFLGKEYENLITLDLACHGVPSSVIWQGYLKKLRKSPRFAGLDGYEFRRRDGWGFAPSVSLGGKFRPIYGVDSLYMEAFNRCALFRKSCYSCPYAKIPRVGDCTIADFWGIGRYGVPFKHDVMKGVSLVLVNNKKGEIALNSLEDVFVEERSLDEALMENRNLKKPSNPHPKRDSIIKAFLDEESSLAEIDRRYHIVDRSVKGLVKMYASKLGLFDIVKRVYNYAKSH